MSFVKAALWIALILVLMPSNGQERYELYATAQRTVADIGGFCTRNPDVCERTSAAFHGVVQKLKNTADSIEDMLREAGIAADRGRQNYKDGEDRERHGELSDHPKVSTTSSMSGDTLTDSDLRPAWRGPGAI